MSGLALVLGIASEPPVAAVVGALQRLGTRFAIVDQRQLAVGRVHTWWEAGSTGGLVEVDGERVDLGEVTGVYTRLTSWAELPHVTDDPERLRRVYQVHHAVDSWLEATTACVVNRTSANDTNNSKPYQALLIRDHFDIPATLVTNDPEEVLAFRQEFGQLIYKSVSGERSIVTSFAESDVERLALLASAPTQFQEYVAGVDVRVHVVGEEVFATRVESNAVDYRYDAAGHGGSMSVFALAPDLSRQCVVLTRRLGLELSGIDLRLADDGRVVCFEVNPSPAYIVYEDVTAQPIAAAIARHLGA